MKRSTSALAICAVLASAPAWPDSPQEKVRKLVQKLSTHTDPQVRSDAAEALGRMKAGDAVPALTSALKDPAAGVRISASAALDELADHAREAAPALKELLADPNLTVRYNAVVVLRKLDAATPAELAPAIAPLLAETDAKDREAALDVLMELGPSEDRVREALIGALKLGPPPIRREVSLRLSRADLELRAGVWVLDLVPVLLDAVDHDQDATVRRNCVHTLRDLRPFPREVVDGLMRALDDSDAQVAGAAAAGLNGAEPRAIAQKAVAHLVKRVKTAPDPAEKIRSAVVLQSLVGYRETFIPGLAQVLASDPDPRVRMQIALTLGDLRGDEGIVPLLRALKTDGDRDVRAAACKGLGAFRAVGLSRAGQLEPVLAALRATAAEVPTDALVKAAQAALAELQK